MNDREELCIVCDEPSTELICHACHALIGAKPLSPAGGAASTDGDQGITGVEAWWDELDEQILAVLDAGRPVETADVAAKLGMSTDAVSSCLAMLSSAGRVRIVSAALRPEPWLAVRSLRNAAASLRHTRSVSHEVEERV